jgi:hypothetical protein
VNDNTIANLANELSDYLAAVDGVTLGNEDEKVTWWAARRETLPVSSGEEVASNPA